MIPTVVFVAASLTVAAHQRSSNKNRSRVLTSWRDENEAGTAAPWDYPMVFFVLTQEKRQLYKII